MDTIDIIKNITITFLIYIITVLVFIKLNHTYWLMIPLFILLIILTRMNIKYTIFLLILGIGGAFTEFLMIYFGNNPWIYKKRESPIQIQNLEIDGYIPLWLPVLWAIASGIGIELNKNMDSLIKF